MLRWRLLARLLLPLAVVLAGVVVPTPAAASTVTATHTTPQPPSCSTTVIVVTAVATDAQPENRVKAISLGPGTRIGDVVSISPDGIRENALQLRWVVVGATLVNLVDPTGHKACADEACYEFYIPQTHTCACGAREQGEVAQENSNFVRDQVEQELESQGLYDPRFKVADNGYGSDPLFACFQNDSLPQCQRGKAAAQANPPSASDMFTSSLFNILLAYSGYLEVKAAEVGGIPTQALTAGGVSSDVESTQALLEDLAQQSLAIAGEGSGPAYGTKAHSIYEGLTEALGDADLQSEVSYLNGVEVKAGTPGSVRYDTLYAPGGTPTAIFDLKTGSAALNAARIQQLLAQLPLQYQDIPVIEIHP